MDVQDLRLQVAPITCNVSSAPISAKIPKNAKKMSLLCLHDVRVNIAVNIDSDVTYNNSKIYTLLLTTRTEFNLFIIIIPNKNNNNKQIEI